MKIHPRKNLALGALVCAAALFAGNSPAATYYFGGSAVCTTGRPTGAIGHATSYGSAAAAQAAVTSAARRAGGNYPTSVQNRTWYQKGWCATARGYNSSRTVYNWSYSFGWSTQNSAINSALSGLGGAYSYGRGYLSGYNY